MINPDVYNSDAYNILVIGLVKLIENEADYPCLKNVAEAIVRLKNNQPNLDPYYDKQKAERFATKEKVSYKERKR